MSAIGLPRFVVILANKPLPPDGLFAVTWAFIAFVLDQTNQALANRTFQRLRFVIHCARLNVDELSVPRIYECAVAGPTKTGSSS